MDSQYLSGCHSFHQQQLNDAETRHVAMETFCSFLWSPYVIRQAIYIFILWFLLLSSFFFFPCLISAVGDWMSAILPPVWCGLSVNLECRSEMCCARLAENTPRKKLTKSRHLGTIPQLCRALSSQLKHVSTIGKKTC